MNILFQTDTAFEKFSQRMAYDLDGNAEYVGYCDPERVSSETDQPCWAIKKIVYDGSGNPSQVLWVRSGRDISVAQVWDDRETLTYV